MNIKKCIVTATMLTTLTVSSGLAQPVANLDSLASTLKVGRYEATILETANQLQCIDKDPILLLEAKKERIQQKVRDGKLEQEKADKIIAHLNEKIKMIEEFNNLNLEDKKSFLLNHYRNYAEKKVAEGKISQDEANQLIEKYNEKVQNWDGNGYPPIPERKNNR